MTQNPKEALQKAGVTRNDLERAKQLMNNPMASFLLGDKKQSVIDGITRAEMLFDKGVQPSTEQVHVDELEQLQANLARLK